MNEHEDRLRSALHARAESVNGGNEMPFGAVEHRARLQQLRARRVQFAAVSTVVAAAATLRCS